MNTDNVTPICGGEPPSGPPAEPGGGLWGEAAALADGLKDLMDGMPGDELTPGYRMSDEARAALKRAIPLLEAALETLEAVQEPEERRYGMYCMTLDEMEGHA